MSIAQPEEVEKQPRSDFYTYILYRSKQPDTPRRIIDPSTGMVPFYVGKGTGQRILKHRRCATYRDTCDHMTCRVIRKEKREGRLVLEVKIAEGITEQEAFNLEKFFISLGNIYGWPLVNRTPGGEGNAGRVQTYEGFISPDGEVFSPIENLQEFCRDTGLSYCGMWLVAQGKQYEHKGWTRYLPPEEREQYRQLFIDSEAKGRANVSNTHKGKTYHAKQYDGFISPSGVIYTDIHNLAAFCREHDLLPSQMCHIASGKRSIHRGWTRYPPLERKRASRFHGTGFIAPDGAVYTDIPHLDQFCEQYGLSQPKMSSVSCGNRKSHRGWTRYDSDLDPPRLF